MITGVILAAGTSSRFGRTKQLLDYRGKPLAQHALDAAAGAGLAEIIVVLGHDADRVRAALDLPPTARTVVNGGYLEGQATSLIAGLAATDATSEGVVVLLADQPGITADHVRALADAFDPDGRPIVRLRFRDGPGPALLSRRVWSDVRTLGGETGARELIAAHPEWVTEVPIDAEAPPDIDTPSDLERTS